MKTLVLEEPGHLRLLETEPPLEPGSGEALVRVKRVGICGTDLHAFTGRQPFFSYPRILGHELGVEIVALGPGSERSGLAVGDRCAVEPYLNCGQCSTCWRGKSNCCPNLKVLGVHIDGGMRELITVPMAKLHKSNALTLEQLALVETLCIGAHAVKRARLEAGECVLVVGAGPIGLSVIQFAQLSGASVIAMEVSDYRLTVCRRDFELERVVDAKHDSLTQLRAFLSQDLPAVVFDATGSGVSMTKAFDYVAHGGRLVLVGLFQGEVSFYDPDFHRREMTVLSTRNATKDDFVQTIGALESGKVNPARWLSRGSSPEGIINEFPHWLEPETRVLKPMLEF